MLNTSVLVRSLKLETLSLFSTWMGDHLGTLGAVGFPFCSAFVAQFRRALTIKSDDRSPCRRFDPG